MTFEVCVDTFETAELAAQYEVDRIELCSALALGGLSPSAALIKKCVAMDGPQIHVMIRPRPGDFIYTAKEVDLMRDEIELAAKQGAHGVVFGCLNYKKELDKEAIKSLVAVSWVHGLETTFHRAIDFTTDISSAMHRLGRLSITRVLTSGGAATAEEGMEQIETLVQENEGNLQIMAGSGVNHLNAKALAAIGVDALHFSADKTQEESTLGMGSKRIPDQDKIPSIINLFR